MAHVRLGRYGAPALVSIIDTALVRRESVLRHNTEAVLRALCDGGPLTRPELRQATALRDEDLTAALVRLDAAGAVRFFGGNDHNGSWRAEC